MPDEQLFQLADLGLLHREDQLRKQVRRMLADPKSFALVQNFAGQWLNLRNLEEVSPDPKKFPVDKRLLADMRTETERFFAEIMRKDRSLLEFIDGRYTFVNQRLAKHYGLAGVRGEDFRRVSLEDQPRAGVLTHASILTLTSNPTRTSPVKRGKWIMENILGTPPPDPPANVPELEETAKSNPRASLREQLELHRKNPTCASCHRQMDALGFGFENFDAVGRWRDRARSKKVDASGNLPSGEKFDGPLALVDILRKRETKFARALTQKMLTYALGRGLAYYDKCAVDKIVEQLGKNDYRFSELVMQIALSEPFRMRRGEANADE